jgi:hypothetical protein
MQAIAAYGATLAAPPGNPGKEALVLKSKALKLINKRLVKVDDPLIYGVSIMWMLEVSVALQWAGVVELCK